jgi:hypothetical protein
MQTFSIFDELNRIMDRALARISDPDTSKQAASTVDTTKLEQIVLDVIKTFPDGCICQDIELALPHMRTSSISPRIKPLLKKGLIVLTGEKRPGFSGRNQQVVKATK